MNKTSTEFDIIKYIYNELNQEEKEKFLPSFFIAQILDVVSLEKLKFGKVEIVKTKLLIERMATGQTAEVRLKGREPLENVPRSVSDHGHSVISLEVESPTEPEDGIHRLILKKAPDTSNA